MGPVGAPGRPVSPHSWTTVQASSGDAAPLVFPRVEASRPAGMPVVPLERVQTKHIILCVHFATVKDEERGLEIHGHQVSTDHVSILTWCWPGAPPVPQKLS